MSSDHSTTASPTGEPGTPGYRNVTSADLHVVTRTLGRAFADDPVWLWMVGDRDDTQARAGRVLSRFARHHLQHDSVLMTNSGEAIAVWAPPGTHILGPIDSIKMTPTLIRALGVGAVSKVPTLIQLERMHPAEPHWYLMVLGTDPAHQRRGFGAKVVQPMLDRADDDGLLTYLESSKEENVPYYRRFGFEVTREYSLPKGGPSLWFMERQPR